MLLAFLWPRTEGQSVADAFAGTPCPIPIVDEPQGETLAFTADGGAYQTVSESTFQPVYRFARERPIPFLPFPALLLLSLGIVVSLTLVANHLVSRARDTE